MSKYWCSDKAFEIAHRCLQLHGGYGYTMDYPIAHYFADTRVASIYGGSNEIMKELIARSL
jgi:alkylation response protein AidB-like acyl-CoA dehydrogenase